jgi:nitrate reductase NapA
MNGMSRRDMLRIVGSVAVANGLGAAMWGALELMVPAATAETWHKSVCRYCGTGQVRKAALLGVRGDFLRRGYPLGWVQSNTAPRPERCWR